MHKTGNSDFFCFFEIYDEKFSFWLKTQFSIRQNASIMSLSCKRDLNEQFEYPFEVLAQLEFEISLKNHAGRNFREKIAKNHKSPGRDL